MTCARGCCETQAKHYQSLGFLDPHRKDLRKVTTDDHGTHTVDVTQHWHDRQDVHVNNLPTIKAKIGPLQ